MYVALRDIRAAAGRFALVATVVALLTLLALLLSGLTNGLAQASAGAVSGLDADRVLIAKPASGSATFASSVIPSSKIPDGDAYHPVGIAAATVVQGDRTVRVSAWGSDGTPAPRTVDSGSVLLTKDAADDLKAGTGDTVSLAGRDLRVSGVVAASSYAHTPVVWMGLSDWQRLDQQGAGEHATAVVVTSGGSNATAAETDAGLVASSPQDARSWVPGFGSENGSLQAIRGFLYAIGALVTAAFFVVWTMQRKGDLAVLGALGASRGLLIRETLGQAVVVLIAGTAIGTAIGVAAGAALGGVLPFALSALTVIGSTGILLVLGLAGAALSLRQVTSVDPAEALGALR